MCSTPELPPGSGLQGARAQGEALVTLTPTAANAQRIHPEG